MDFNFGSMINLIPIAKGFSLIAVHLSSELKIKVVKFDLTFDAVNRKVNYTVYSDQIENGHFTAPFEKGEKYIDLALNYVKDKIPEGCTIHSAVVKYEAGSKSIGYLFFENNGVKESVKYEF